MQDPAHARGAGFGDHGRGIVLGVARVDDDRPIELARDRELRREGAPLQLARRVVVMGVETAFADRDGAARDELANGVRIADRVEAGRVVRMHARGEEHEARVRRRDLFGAAGGIERLTDRNDSERARDPGALDCRVAVPVERGIREVRVTVDERGQRAPAVAGRSRRGCSVAGLFVDFGAPGFSRGHRCSM